ncbi:nucleotide-sugar transporter-domain-containing protein [Massariosphaeria phaeospora]|uniref:DNA 3'-5' helicase n=1 Tax=Massariosphaeria phaeospora TaxID=100035 RepID=A0A7C8MFU0_9PLEO|nr:nucleotide-sugar transporter-domain-containing protein [Massariosphaeria phaeospora]
MGIDANRRGGTLGGVPLKHLSLITLTFQNSALILIMHYSRVMKPVNGLRYHTSTSVFLNEVIKLAIGLTMALYDISTNLPPNTPATVLFQNLITAVFTNESWKLAIPAALYTLQNTLQYVAVSNLDAATFQVTYQLKILTTATFSVLMLGRTLSPRRWASLLLLIIGVSIVQFPHTTEPTGLESLKDPDSKIWARSLGALRDLGNHAAAQLVRRSATYEGIDEDVAMQNPQMNASVGLAAVLVACALSGLAGVTFEKVLKDSNTKTSLWIRNLQLSFWSIFPSLFLGVIWVDGENISKTGFFAGYNWIVWMAITFQALGGVIVALVINYADNIAKNFATSISIIISCLASVFFFDFKITRSYLLGTSVVLFATYLYSAPERTRPSPIRIAEFEKTTIDGNPSYFNSQQGSLAKSPIRAESLSTSRPSTPTVERHHFKDYSDLKHRRTNRDASQHPILQPQHRHSARPMAPRERYRLPRDIVEDEDQYDDEIALDSFDQDLLHQPYDDRQRQATEGRARLSFAPKASSRSFTTAPSSRNQASYRPVDDVTYANAGTLLSSAGPRSQSVQGRFAYNDTQSQNPSSDGPDAQLGASSSPAFKASQRRAETTYAPDTRQPGKSVSVYDNQADKLSPRLDTTRPHPQDTPARPAPKRLNLPHAPPVVQGIPLVPITSLPDRLRTVFPFPTFNAVQSKCFDRLYKSEDNFVLASPTGSGKTAILELAICRAVATNATGQYKIVYQAPTKALCSERQRDWQKKFSTLGLNCAELTGDSDVADLRNVQSANIIVTTPEKWDSITRKWKDHDKLMRLIKLFLIDEVHILREDRGAILETVVSRMKSIGTDVRFVALSATVPNFIDVAVWLGKNAAEPYEPAMHASFGEEFRPVKLKKHVCGYSYNSPNDFAFDKVLDSKLPDVIAKYSERKPIMVFCCTRTSAVSTAKVLANWWASRGSQNRMWTHPSKPIAFKDHELRDCAASGVVFHHAGVEPDDRIAIENGFLKGEIGVICCTSTLAVGVNLPCHLVIIKNTVSFTNTGLQEYADLEVMQMLGRAGRPQFDNSAVGVIMTRQTKVHRYEAMVTGKDLLESTLHLNLIDHLNAEVGLGTIYDLDSARKWLAGTFLYVRLKQNPSHYKLEGARSGQSIDEQLDDICVRDVTLLQETNLVTATDHFRCTEFGHAMARYYVHFGTMRVFMGLQSKAHISEILSAIAQASEFETIRLRANEKNFYKLLNKSPSIRFTIPVNLALPAHKVSLIIQSVLGAADLSGDEELQKNRVQYNLEAGMVFKRISSLVRCVIDCQITLGDSVSTGNALMLERSLSARVWDDSPLQMKQLEGIGVVAVRKLANAGIRTVEELEYTDAHKIDMILGKNPPYGLRLLDKLKNFPKLRVSLHIQPNSIVKTADGVKVQVKAEIGFINEKTPQSFGSKLVYVMVHEKHTSLTIYSGSKLGKGQTLVFPSMLTSADQCINCYLMCDGIAGTMRDASVNPKISPSMFPTLKPVELSTTPRRDDRPLERPTSNMSRRRLENAGSGRRSTGDTDEFGDDDIDDDELMKATWGDLKFDHIENYANPTDNITRKNTAKNASTKGKTHMKSSEMPSEKFVDDDEHEPKQLANGRWACNHKCKDKQVCKHMCCRDGLDKPPKKPMKKTPTTNEAPHADSNTPLNKGKMTQSKLQLAASKRRSSAAIETLDLTQQEKKRKADYGMNGPRDYRNLHQLHKNIQKKEPPSSLASVMHKKPAYSYGSGGEHNLSFLPDETVPRADRRVGTGDSSDYGDIPHGELPNYFDQPAPSQFQQQDPDYGGMDFRVEEVAAADHQSDKSFCDEDSLLGDAMIGLADSQDLRAIVIEDEEDSSAVNDERTARHDDFSSNTENIATSSTMKLPQKARPRFLDQSSSSPHFPGFQPAKSRLKTPELAELRQPKVAVQALPKRKPSEQSAQYDDDDLDCMDLCDAELAAGVQTDGRTDGTAKVKEEPVETAFKDIEPWVLQEFGGLVEIVDD